MTAQAALPVEDSAAPIRLRSLRFRLISLSLAWLLVSLLATGFVLVLLFRAESQRHLDDSLRSRLEDLMAAARVAPDGRLDLAWKPADRRFETPLSGWYWQVGAGDVVIRSASLSDSDPPTLPSAPRGVEIFDNLAGPGGVGLRVAAQEVRSRATAQVVSAWVAAPCVTVRADVFAYIGWLAAALGTLGVALGGLIVMQVVYGLRPLALVRVHLANVRLGRRDRLAVEGPAEIAPLIQELDTLLEEHDRTVTQARAAAGDLAHALKTPLAVIRNEARALAGEAGATMTAEADRMARVVEHHLVSARTAPERRRRKAQASLDRVMEDVGFTLRRLYPERRLVFNVPPGLAANCAEDDLGEMIGNLADNACKWASTQVRISADQTASMLRVEVADDGPGLKAEECVQVLEQGGRLDERVPGHGLGLSIAVKLAALHGGSLRLQRSDLGGLAAILELPASSAG